MPERASCEVKLIEGHRLTRRGLAFLICKDNKDIRAKEVFDALQEEHKRYVRVSFDAWLDNKQIENRFHGWSEPGYKECFCFRWKENRLRHRLYGFLCKPNQLDPGFMLCVLAMHATKTQHATEQVIKDTLNRLRTDETIIAKTKELFSAPSGGKR